MKTLIINSSHYIANSGNQYVYNLPQSTRFEAGDQIGVASIAMYNSTFNITAARQNNTFTIVWNANFTYTFTLVFPDGYYSVQDMNNYLQYYCLSNGLYCTTNNGSTNVYFLEIVVNATRYAIQLNSYFLPSAANAATLGYAMPLSVAWSFPASNSTPQMTFGANFGALLGFPALTLPPSIQTINYSQISSITPIISPVNTYIMCCNLISSKYSMPNNTFFALPLNAGLGSLIIMNPSQIVFNDIASNVYTQIVITFYDQLFNKLQINDIELTLTLAIKEK